MKNTLIKDHFNSIQACLDWANNLISNYNKTLEMPEAANIEQFQIIMHNEESYTIIILIRIKDLVNLPNFHK